MAIASEVALAAVCLSRIGSLVEISICFDCAGSWSDSIVYAHDIKIV